jgi:hypothetical protein
MMTVAQISRSLAYGRDEYVNRVVDQLLDALRYYYESRLTSSRARRAALERKSRDVLDTSFVIERLHDIRFSGRRGALGQTISEARRSESRLRHIVEASARRPGALGTVDTATFWRSVDAVRTAPKRRGG